jgi:hypothetical protein
LHFLLAQKVFRVFGQFTICTTITIENMKQMVRIVSEQRANGLENEI